MHPELEKLIDMVIADGQVTEKERAVVIKKAIALDVDPDEAEIYLDGKLHQLNQANKQIVFPAPPLEKKSNKEGDLKKCPACGAPVESFNTNCGDCGHEFRGIETVNSVKDFFKQLNDIENNRSEDETNPLKALGGMYSKALSNGGVFGGGKIEQQKKEFIRNYPIPNTKEDILEFLSLGVPRAKKTGGLFSTFGQKGWENMAHNNMLPIWKTKCEQIIMKARLSMKDDKKTLDEIEYYAKQLNIK